MSESNPPAEPPAGGEAAVRAALQEMLTSERRCPFGPRFFLEQIPTFLRDHCPDPAERLPRLVLTVQGEPVVVCHVVAVAPRWVAVAARDEREDAGMRTELIAYETISRVTIGGAERGSCHPGFDATQRPVMVDGTGTAAEDALAAAAGLRRRAAE